MNIAKHAPMAYAPNPPGTMIDKATDAHDALVPALLDDMGRIFRQLGIESCRASVVDMGSMSYQGAWWMSESGAMAAPNHDLPLDSQYPGASATITQLADVNAGDTVVQRMSPRHWSFAWRLDAGHVVVAEARYIDPRTMIVEIDSALVRLLCDTGIRSALDRDDDDDTALTAPSMQWPATQERRQRRRPKAALRWSVALTMVSGLLALWMGLVALPDAQGDVARLGSLVERTMVSNLSNAMATGDYGEVQQHLSWFQDLGYFQGAAITNARQKFVALAGAPAELRIGDAPSSSFPTAGRSLDLATGSEKHGKLLLLSAGPGGSGEGRMASIRSMAAAAFAAAAIATALMLLRQRRARRNGD